MTWRVAPHSHSKAGVPNNTALLCSVGGELCLQMAIVVPPAAVLLCLFIYSHCGVYSLSLCFAVLCFARYSFLPPVSSVQTWVSFFSHSASIFFLFPFVLFCVVCLPLLFREANCVERLLILAALSLRAMETAAPVWCQVPVCASTVSKC